MEHFGTRRSVSGVGASAVCEAIEGRTLLSTSVLTWHNDNSRDGLNSDETMLTQNAVKTDFGLRHTIHVDGAVYAQPLYVPGVKVNGVKRNLVLIATQHDSVYAYDADTGVYVWKRSFIDPGHGVTPVPAADTQSTDISPEIGITGTPVIDGSTGTMYFVTKVKVVKNGKAHYEQRLRGVDITNGRERVANGVLISGSVPGAGEGAEDGDDGLTLTFDPLKQNQRSALTLSNGMIYVTYASHGDVDPYNGWVFAFNKTSLKKIETFVTAPDGIEAPIWMSGSGLAVDSSGYLYAATGNGTFDVPAGGDDYGDTVLKLKDGGDTLKVADYFTPYNASTLLRQDLDLGSGGVTLLPDQAGAHKHEMVIGGKQGILYLIDRDNLGKFHTNSDAVVQKIDVGSAIFGTAAYANGSIYLVTVNGKMLQFKLTNGKLSAKATSASSEVYAFPGTSPSVSSDGTRNGIVWTIERRIPAGTEADDPNAGVAVLHAYDPNDLAREFFVSGTSTGGSNYAGRAIKFTVPTVADGHVFVGGNKTVAIFGTKTAIA